MTFVVYQLWEVMIWQSKIVKRTHRVWPGTY